MMMDTSYKNHSHTDSDTSNLIQRLADKIHDLKIQQYVPDREVLSSKIALDLLKVGWEKLAGTSLKNFNAKIQKFRDHTSIC
jgi:hypothetical protein